MRQINIMDIVLSKYPGFLKGFPSFVKDFILFLLNKLLHVKEVNDFIEKHHDKGGLAFADEILEYLEFSYTYSNRDKARIPNEGKLIIIANHPLGGLDGIALLKMIGDVRSDVKIVVNDFLLHLDNLSDLFLPFDILSQKNRKEGLQGIINALQNDNAVIFFPAGEVSRLTLKGIKDSKWQKGAVHLALKYQAPVLPVHIKARNSLLFYFTSLISKPLSMLLLPRELFNKHGKSIDFTIGDHIAPSALPPAFEKRKLSMKLLKKHTKLIGKGKKGIFQTEKNIIHPLDRKKIIQQLYYAPLLGKTDDGLKIYLLDYDSYPDVINEIGRLREVTFRKVGEGTGNRVDLDRFDRVYKHLVLWNEKEVEIVGSYRIGVCDTIIKEQGYEGLYTSTLFRFSEAFQNILPQSVEMGRSFVQKKYWNTAALNYLWQGIGAFLAANLQIKFMFGPTSLSNSFSTEAKDMIVFFYDKWFNDPDSLVKAKHPYSMSTSSKKELIQIFSSDDYRQELRTLKLMLKPYGYTIPTLYKQYADLCDPGGVLFSAFGVDQSFQNCTDAFIIASVDKVKEKKRKRFIEPYLEKMNAETA